MLARIGVIRALQRHREKPMPEPRTKRAKRHLTFGEKPHASGDEPGDGAQSASRESKES